MRKLFFYVAILFAATSCQKEDETIVKGRIKFSMNKAERNTTSSRLQDERIPTKLLIGIEEVSEYSGKEYTLNLYGFGQSWASDAIELQVGEYKLYSFLILDQFNQIMYATPVEGSELAQYVVDPLPIDFNVSENEMTLVTPQVIAVEANDTPESFGYVSFSFDVVDPNLPTDTLNEIMLSFDGTSLINPNFVNKGFDSVIVKFVTYYPSFQEIERKLVLVSPTSAVGSVSYNEFNWWNVQVYAYFESIDGVDNIHHTIELRAGATEDMLLDQKLREIKLGSQITRVGSNPIQQPLYWQSKSILFDETGYWHLEVENDICNPLIVYKLLKNDVLDVYYSKELFYADTTLGSIGFRSSYVSNPQPYVMVDDIVTFFDMCPQFPTGKILGALYFDIVKLSTAEPIGCYLVWTSPDTPIDPKYSMASSSYLKVLTRKEAQGLNLTQEKRRPFSR